jgi:outer membrane protein OmpA-like peptidoglycan-associated protein
MKKYFPSRGLKLFIILTCWVMTVQLQAQESTQQETSPAEDPVVHNFARWEAGLFLGAANAYGDLIDTRFVQLQRANLGYGVFARYNASRNLSVRGSFTRAKLEGSDLDFESLAARGLSFESTINEFAVIGEWDFFGDRRYNNKGGFRRMISPYIFLGVGLGINDLSIDYSSLEGKPRQEVRAIQDQENTKGTQISTPIGIGVNVDLSERLHLSFEFGYRPVFNDYLDGVSATGNPNRNDWYSMAGATIAYRIAGKDTDGDGYPDHVDPCPDKGGSEAHLGCPDTDEDGIPDRLDRCPEAEGPAATNGCPDGDGDGIADDEDECPTIPGSKAANGCADMDGDGIIDSEDECPSIAGAAEFNGCRDTDGDGIQDSEDRCPYEKGPVENEGCPPPPDRNDPNLDSDGDGVPDIEDECPSMPGDPALKGCKDVDNDGVADPYDNCPYEKGTPERNGCPDPDDPVVDSDGDGFADQDDLCPETPGSTKGCPDSDGDGLTDNEDDCPQVAGPKNRQGCPELTDEDLQLLEAAVDNITFNQASYSLLSSSHQTLDLIAELMQQYPTYHLRIEGHTDNQGDPDANKQLSQLRAKACMEYLNEQGISRDRIIYEGYGGERPRATNDTQSGRRRNRRVEFDLFDPNK